jgi:pyruvate/2-oxoglutarate dehydrogenase complex dihydrolipoamide dehydrogenase (E3) component
VATRFDAIVIGAGQAGPFLVGRLTAAGKKVAIVERKLFGGTCVNTGCTPTKAMVASAYAAHVARRAADYGVTLSGTVGIDMKAVKARKDAIVARSRNSQSTWLESMENCTVYKNHARFESSHEVRVGDELLSADQIFLNVGGRASVPPLPGVDKIKYLTNVSMMEVEEVPERLVIVGGSYIGLEFGHMFRRFGSDVTIVEKMPRVISREDEDVSKAVQEILEKDGVKFRTSAECIHFEPHGDEIGVGVDCKDGDPVVMGTHVLLAMGRRPNTDDLGLDRADVEVDGRGYIKVDDQLRTNVPGIWAMGDCNGRGAFTHTAYSDFEIVAANLLDNDPRKVTDRIVTYGLFIDPPLGRVGMTEAEVKKSGRKALVGMRPMTKVNRAVEKGESEGFMKVVVDAETKEILGAAILGVGGDEAVHCITDVMYAKAPYTTISRAVHIHPTVSELIPTVLQDLKPLE